MIYQGKGTETFPKGFSLASLMKQKQQEDRMAVVYDKRKVLNPVTNVWMGKNQELFEESLRAPQERGDNPQAFYNLFLHIIGVPDKLTYAQELFHWKMELEERKRNFFSRK